MTPKIFLSGFVHHSGFANPDSRVVGVTGVEPVTLRLSSACSNQLSYTPGPSSERWSVSALERDSRERSHALRFDAPTQFGGAEETRTPDL